jgi:hypothetical protein
LLTPGPGAISLDHLIWNNRSAMPVLARRSA